MKGKLLLTALVLASTAAIASEQQGVGQLDSPAKLGATIGFDDMKAACLNPGRYHNQAAPSNIQLSCRDVQIKWLPDVEKSIVMSGSRQITTALQSDKYNVESMTEARAGASQALGCPRYKEVSETLETVRAVTCDELVAYKGTATDFCEEVIDSLRASNAQSVNIADTGRATDYCSAPAPQNAFWPWHN